MAQFIVSYFNILILWHFRCGEPWWMSCTSDSRANICSFLHYSVCICWLRGRSWRVWCACNIWDI